MIFAIVFLALALLIGGPLFFLFYRAPTCFDGKQNGDETGVDCGGSCQMLCTSESLPLIQRGDPRVLSISPGVFSVVAMVENPNPNADIYRAGYIFRLYSGDSPVPSEVREGETYVPKGNTFAVFEGPLELGGVVPTRAVFEWKQDTLLWRNNESPVPEVVVRSSNISRIDSAPRLDATVSNLSNQAVSNIDFVALLYDETGSIFAASKTFVDFLPAGESAPIVFTWPRPFGKEVLNTNIVIRLLPDGSFIR